MCHIAPPLANWNQLKPGSMQVCNPIVFIGKVVRIDCGFSLTVNFQCITFIVKDTHFDCGFWYHFCTAKYHNIIPQSNLTTLPINWVELSLCNITKLNTTSESYKLCYINKQWTGVFCNWFLWIESQSAAFLPMVHLRCTMATHGTSQMYHRQECN